MMFRRSGRRACQIGLCALLPVCAPFAAAADPATAVTTPVTNLATNPATNRVTTPVAAATAAATRVIVSPEHAGQPLDREQLRAFFTTRLREWPDHAPVRLFVMPEDSDLHDRFCREQLGMFPYVLQAIWDRLQFTGTGLVPTVVRSEDEMRRRVLGTPGAIGYVEAEPAPASGDQPAAAGSNGGAPADRIAP